MLDRAKFDRVLAMLADLNREKGCFILLTPPFAAAIEVRRPEALDALSDQGIARAERDSAVRDITDLVIAELREQVDDFIEHKALEGEEGTAEEWRSRSDAVANLLVDDRLRRRYLLKRLSKAPAFVDVDWDVKVKLDDAGESEFKPFPYATLKLKFQREFGDGPWFFLGSNTLDSVQVNFSRDELDYLVHSLKLASDALTRAEEEPGT